MSAHDWRPRARNYASEARGTALAAEPAPTHPLVPDRKTTKQMTVRTVAEAPSSTAAASETAAPAPPTAATPVVSDPLGVVKSKASFDPLGVIKAKTTSDPLGVSGNNTNMSPASDAPFTPAPSIMEKALASSQVKDDDTLGDMIEEGFVPWASKKAAILQRYTTDETVGIMASFMQDVPNRVAMPVETTQQRLKELETPADDEERLLQVSQADYIKHIESLEGALRRAWDEEQNRVLALKIAIRCAKVLGDTSVIQFYPSKFVLVSEILDAFGNLVFERIKERASEEDAQGRFKSLPSDFSAADVNDFARETCKNWFHKVASIRELLPRLYVEMALLHCYRFIYNDPFETLLNRVNMQLRGVCDPLVATYARAYLARVGTRLKPRLKPYLVTGFVDHLDVMKQNIDGNVIERVCKLRNIDPLKYYDLYSPALDWMLQCLAHNNKSTATLQLVLSRYKQMGDALTLNHIIRNFHPSVAAANCEMFCTLIREADDRGLQRHRLWASLGMALILASPPTSTVSSVWRDVWGSIVAMLDAPPSTPATPVAQHREESLTAFVNLCEIWIEFPVKYMGLADVSAMLSTMLDRLRTPEKEYARYMDQLQSVAQKVLSGYADFVVVARVDKFHELCDLFTGEHQTQVHKAILRSFRACKETSVNDPVLIEHVFTAAKTAHDSINSLSFDDERRQVSELLCAFISKVDFGRQVEKQLTFLSDARRAFGNFDSVKARLVHSVAALVMRTLKLAGGAHTGLTTPFVRACVAYCYITIPSIEDVFVRLNLYVMSANVALLNGALGQAEDLLKSAVTLFGDSVPPHPENLESEMAKRRCRATEQKMLAFAIPFVALLVVMPGHPELGPFYLLHGFVRVLRAFKWLPASEVPLHIDLSLLRALCALAQDELPVHLPGLESNDVLYGGDDMYRNELHTLLDECVAHLLEQLAALKAAGAEMQSLLTSEFFDVTVSLAELNSKSANLAVNLLSLAKQSVGPEGDVGPLKRAFAALRFRSTPFHEHMAAKLTVP